MSWSDLDPDQADQTDSDTIFWYIFTKNQAHFLPQGIKSIYPNEKWYVFLVVIRG
jgi:hypothetical protein